MLDSITPLLSPALSPNMAAKTTPDNIVVHPLVLLSVVDHYNRVAKSTKKRVVGVLLGQWKGRTVNVANSYARASRVECHYDLN